MNDITKQLLIARQRFDPETGFTGAFNIREDGGCAGRQNSQNIEITSKSDKPGIDIRVKPGTKGETVYIPACVTHSKVDDLVYNDFYIGAGADVIMVAGCGVHTDGEESSQHNGIHRFFLEPGRARPLPGEAHRHRRGHRQAHHQPRRPMWSCRRTLPGDGHHPDQGGGLHPAR